MGAEPLVVCWGEILWDMFPDGRKLGGAPANVAFHLAQLGSRVALASRVGDDELGAAAIATLQSQGVEIDGIQIDPERGTGEVGVCIEAGEATYTLYPGRAWERIALSPPTRQLLPRARVFCYGTLSQRTAEGAASLRAALAALPADCTTVCDPNLRKIPIELDVLEQSLRSASVVKLADTEATRIEQRFGVTDAATWLLTECQVSMVALTFGASGSALITASGRVDHSGFPAEPGGDNVGAGDAYVAALIHLTLAGASPEHMAEQANRYASRVASHRGATPILAP